ncbi:MAG: ATP-grasp domain-containing protein [Coriobacteriia bacterium]|nr:ATP-grasp domain-containing protein [Coriobacteriia bacterium]
MEKIIVVECLSSSMSYIYDIRQEGYEPVILETYNNIIRRKSNYTYMDKPLPRIINALPNYEDTLNLVRKENPKLILAGCEQSVELATLLANDLGLMFNPKSHLPYVLDKHKMQIACKEAGLRYIEGKMVSSEDEAVDFFNKCKKGAVLKPKHGASSFNVCVCSKECEVREAFNKIKGCKNLEGDVNEEVIIQERIVGPEYIVNTITRDNETYVSSMYIYSKKHIPGAANIYDLHETITHDEINNKIKEMMDYAIKTTKAVGVKYGPVHGEFMIDEDGPVLIEVNCRICGADMPRKFLDQAFGHHETNLSLDSYLHPEKFKKRMSMDYFTPGKGYLKTLIIKDEIDILDAPICRTAKELPTFFMLKDIDEKCPMHLVKTIDLSTTGGKIFFVSDDSEQVTKDCKEICRLEEEEYDKLYTID